MKCIVFVVMFLLGVISLAEAGMDEANEAYERGDYESAYREWLPLAEQGDAVAQHKLGLIYADGDGVAQDGILAVKWFRKAAEQGHVEAQSNLGLTYLIGLIVPQDYAEAVKWLKRAAQQGNAKA